MYIKKEGPRYVDLTGRRFDKVVVLKMAGRNNKGYIQWLCRCDCGKEVIRSRYFFKDKEHVHSCGCFYKHKIRRDLTGQKFGRWVVIKHDDKTNYKGEHFWLCRCSCGKEKVINAFHLYTGASKSCGCLSNEVRLKGLKFGEGGFKKLLHNYTKSSKERGLLFSLSTEEFRNLVTGNCFYCGSSPLTLIKVASDHSRFFYNGIDRVNNKKGYEKGNVVSCCGTCNRMKYTLTKNEFIKQCGLIYKHQLSIC